jgi:hypothetical protein
MKPEVPRVTAPPESQSQPQLENSAASAHKSAGKYEIDREKPAQLPTSARERRLPFGLFVMVVVYGLWLGWLAYVAWINVRAGNQ